MRHAVLEDSGTLLQLRKLTRLKRFSTELCRRFVTFYSSRELLGKSKLSSAKLPSTLAKNFKNAALLSHHLCVEDFFSAARALRSPTLL